MTGLLLTVVCWSADLADRQKPSTDSLEFKQLLACEAAAALASKSKQKAVEVLVTLSRKGTATVRNRATQCLMDIGGKEAMVALTKVLHDNNPQVRATAVTALGMMRVSQTKSMLPRLFDTEKHIEVKLATAQALGRLCDKTGLTYVVGLLKGDDPHYRRAAAVVLGDIIGQRFAPTGDGVVAALRYLNVRAAKFKT